MEIASKLLVTVLLPLVIRGARSAHLGVHIAQRSSRATLNRGQGVVIGVLSERCCTLERNDLPALPLTAVDDPFSGAGHLARALPKHASR